MDERPNILCFVCDQLRADHLGCYGNPDVATPCIDRLAAEGMTLEESYVANPLCMPNRASLFTGMYPKAHGVRTNGYTLHPSRPVLPELLRRAGYQTASIGKIHLSDWDPAPSDIVKRTADEPFEAYESAAFWERADRHPGPYYGLEHVYLVDGHGNYVFGHYKKELERDHPGLYDLLRPEHALGPARLDMELWKAAIPAELHYNAVIARKTVEFLDGRDPGRPFFVWCSFPDPHHPYSPPRPYCDRYDPDAITFRPKRRPGELEDLPPYLQRLSAEQSRRWRPDGTDRGYREILAHTYGMISMVDRSIGEVMAHLEQAGLLDDTIVVFLSDHGDLMGDHWLNQKGPYLYRPLVRVPTIWRFPRAVPRGARSQALVSAVDFAPTLLDFAGVPAPGSMQGRSYRAVLEGRQEAFREWIYIENDHPVMPQRQLRSRRWAFTLDLLGDSGLLFDLVEDPDELYNLFGRPQRQGLKKDLMAEMLRQTLAADDWFESKPWRREQV